MTRTRRRVAYGALALCLAHAPAGAQDSALNDLAGRAADAVRAGRTVDALDLANRFEEAVWDAAPLAFRKTELVDAEPMAFGDDAPRADNVYEVDEEIHLYVEPVAFGWSPRGDGFATDMVADVRVATPDGTIIVAHKGFSEFRVAAPNRDHDVFLAITYVFGGLGPGDYVVTTTLRDRVDDKTAAFDTAITIR